MTAIFFLGIVPWVIVPVTVLLVASEPTLVKQVNPPVEQVHETR